MHQPSLQQGAEEGEESRGNVVEHDAGSFREALELADGPWFENVKEAKEDESEEGIARGGRYCDESDELAGDFVDDDVAGVFFAGFAGDKGGGWDSDERDDGCSDCGGDCQR